MEVLASTRARNQSVEEIIRGPEAKVALLSGKAATKSRARNISA
jgi:hypothetical protein